MNYCANCAAPLPPGAEFCPKCGRDLRVDHAAPAPIAAPPARRRTPWWVVPLVIVGLVVVAFLVLLGLPFGGRDADRPVSTAAKTETVAEADPVPSAAPVPTGTLIDVTEEPPPEVLAPTPTQTTATTATIATTPPVRTTPPPARTVPAPRTEPRTEPRRETPPPAAEERSEEIGVSEAMSIVRGFVTSRDYYGVGANCIAVGSLGYQNVGYTLEVRDSCSQRSLGRWRVDAKTRELFRQREDGRYLRP